MKKWKLATIGLSAGLALLAVVLIFVSGDSAMERSVQYQITLEQTTSRIVSLNEPFAMALMMRQVPGLQEVEVGRSDLAAIEQELEALGKPPPELAEAHNLLLEAVDFYQEALDGLMDNLEAGWDPPFDTDFIAAASQGGGRVHLAAQALTSSADVD